MIDGAIDSTVYLRGSLIGRGVGTALVALALLAGGCGGDGGGSGDPDTGSPTGEEGTLAFEIMPDWERGDERDEQLVALQEDGASGSDVRIVKNGRYLRVIFTTEDGEESEISLDISDWASGEAHSIAATWGDGATTLYVDGSVVGTNTYAGSVGIPPGTPLVLGSDEPVDPDGATIRDFHIFGRPLDEGEIDIVQNGGVRLTMGSATVGGRGDQAEICVDFSTGGVEVAGTQNDLHLSDDCARILGCRATGTHGKSVTPGRLVSSGAEKSMKILVLSITDVNPIPDGPLYCCSFRARRESGCCPIGIGGGLASDPGGRKLVVDGLSGSLCVDAVPPEP